ncbi:hypothetical protein [Pararobbsia silviterrae]|uniref:Lipoprotein n=1 Tax=Pararobbsia silviterrae TaxID=1792498 RepID=A0A494Y5A5_9BURK|nr:hypothetical protein [Pararobbsia silviterrae]RKP57453.1 hypothetical protein D7S86_05625 [Pararobbsia silviterrae]
MKPQDAPRARTPRLSIRRMRALAIIALSLTLGACMQPWQAFQPGADQSAIVARFGEPKEVYDLPNGNKHLLWPTRPFGETTVGAEISPDGKLVNLDQMLTDQNFARVIVGQWTKHDIQITFGLPEETAYFPLMKREVWSYRYMQANVWYRLYHFYFDDQGVVRMTQTTEDPLHDPTRRFPF